MLARIGWIVIVLPALGLFIAHIPTYFAALHLLHSSDALAFTGQLTRDDMSILRSWGLSLDFYAICMLVAGLLFQFSYATVGILLFWRRSDDRVALLVSFALMLFPFGFAELTLQGLPRGWSWVILTLIFLGNASMMLCAYIFPDGRFVPRWTRWLALVMIGHWAASTFFIFLYPFIFRFTLLLGLIISTVMVQIYRYYFASSPQQRQQTRWVVFGIAIAVTGNIVARLLAIFVLPLLLPGSSLVNAVEVILISCSMLVIPPTLAIAILHSRLWDIDVIINRTLVYSFLTATLALVYIGLVIGLQFLLRGLTEGNQLAIIGSTLIIAALFQPLRQRIQTVIDRRFYRHKYDATRTLEAFSATLRNELDLEQLSEQLTSVVEETMQPTHVSLWLRKPEQKKGAPLTGNPFL
ncbi:MAG: hypothetical protein ACJ795_11670 [Ktedonobacteraceae bacterium]